MPRAIQYKLRRVSFAIEICFYTQVPPGRFWWFLFWRDSCFGKNSIASCMPGERACSRATPARGAPAAAAGLSKNRSHDHAHDDRSGICVPSYKNRSRSTLSSRSVPAAAAGTCTGTKFSYSKVLNFSTCRYMYHQIQLGGKSFTLRFQERSPAARQNSVEIQRNLK